MIQNVIILKIFFWKYYFGHATFYIWPEVPVDIIRVFFNFRFSSRKYSRKSQSQQKLAHSVQYSFAQKASLIWRSSAYLTLKIICFRNTAKNLSDFKNFPANMFLFGASKNICTALFLDAHELHSWSTLKEMSVYFFISP